MLLGLSGPVAELAATGLTVAWGRAGAQSWPGGGGAGVVGRNLYPLIAKQLKEEISDGQ
jgi:hypothetical protein